MRKRKKWLLLLLLIGVALPFIYVEANKKIYASRVHDYLIEEKKYRKEDIKAVEGVWGKKLPSFYATVIFKNELNIQYTYFAHNGIHQAGYEAMDDAIITYPYLLRHYEPHKKQ